MSFVDLQVSPGVSLAVTVPNPLTAGQLLTLALLDSGVTGQGITPSGEDINNALIRCNMMLSQWARKRWLIWSLTDVAFTSTGAISYSVGTGADFNIARPARLEDGCFMRQLNNNAGQPIDFPLQLLTSHEDYNRIRLKTMGTFPSCVFYDSAYPTANVFFWPVPQSGIYELHILVKTPLNRLPSLATPIFLPEEYQAALLYNLQARLRSAYRLPVDPVIVALAEDALNLIRNANVQVPTLRMPNRLLGKRIAYNVFSDDN